MARAPGANFFFRALENPRWVPKCISVAFVAGARPDRDFIAI
jgi:hypothetical protein